MCFLNITVSSSAVIILFTVIYFIYFVNLLIMISIELKAVSSSKLEDKSVMKFIVISFYSSVDWNNDCRMS